ncbi:aberrant root formation protein 4 isoform X2 [Papaver somniferum]|uniref:aberrant root formation protein 4 isoform X2 n=1 Tax=Papaver somniferum TaxID=3469 RepID=UPI000E6FFB10|nr:aberrant root formation protein 4 isoform X2 [Papaver somniferum]
MKAEKMCDSSISSAHHPLVLRLHETLTNCSKILAETGDIPKSVANVVGFLNYILDDVVSDPENESFKENTLLVLTELNLCISSPSLDETVLDALSFELPEVVAQFAFISDKCREMVESVTNHIVLTSNPRDMLAILCEALDSHCKVFQEPVYFTPLLSGLARVFRRIERRKFEQIKVALPVVLNVLKSVVAESDNEKDGQFEELFARVLNIATSMQEVSQQMEAKDKEKLKSLLGLFVLEMMAISHILAGVELNCISLVVQLSRFLPLCGFPYIGLITGSVLVNVTSIVCGEDDDNYMKSFPLIKQGASISVIWAHISDEVGTAAEEDLSVIKHKLQSSRTKRWQAVGMLKYLLSSTDQPCEVKNHAIEFLLSIFNGKASEICNDEEEECSSYTPSLLAALQAIQRVIIFTSGALVRNKAFSAFKMVLADIPSDQRFDIIKALIILNTNAPSMIGLLLGLVKEMVYEDYQLVREAEKKHLKFPFWNFNVLELLELVLRPPKGGPPSLPEQNDAVSAALTVYRFLLMIASKETSYIEVLSESSLRKVYSEWLLPLRTLVSGMVEESKEGSSQFEIEINCSFLPVMSNLYPCIELVEDKLKNLGCL